MAQRSHAFHARTSQITLHRTNFLGLIVLLFMLIIWTVISAWWFLTSATTTLEYNKKIEDERTRYEEELLALSTEAEELKGNDRNLENMVHALLTRAKALQARQILLSSLAERLHHNLIATLPTSKTILNAPLHMNDTESKNDEPLHHLSQEEEENEDFEGPTHQKPMPLAERDSSHTSSRSFTASYHERVEASWTSSASSPSYSTFDGLENVQGKSLKEQVSAVKEITQRINQQYILCLHKMIMTTHKTSTRLQSVLTFVGLKNHAVSQKKPHTNTELSAIGGPLVPLSSAFLSSDENFPHIIHALKKTIEDTLHFSKILEYVPIMSPKPGPVSVSSSFGARFDPFTRGMAMHTGVDMRMAHGSPVYATAAGKVSAAHHSGGYGLLVEIDHGYGFRTRYAHLSRIHVVSGQKIGRGTLIGAAGSTGRSTGPHLHYEVRLNGRPTNPVRFLKALTQAAP